MLKRIIIVIAAMFLLSISSYSQSKSNRYDLTTTSILSVIVPGAGHVYIGEPLKGLPYFAGLVASYSAISAGGYNMAVGSKHPKLGAALFLGGLALYVTDIVLANKSARKIATNKMTIQPIIGNYSFRNNSIRAGGLQVTFSF